MAGKTRIPGAVIIIGLLLGCITALPAAGAAPLVLKLNHQFPADTPGSRVDQWFSDQVRIRTNGEVEIRIFWSNGLGEPRENLSLLRRGRIDMAAMSPGYFPEALPLLAAPNSIPMAMDNVCQASEIMAALLREIPELGEEAGANGIRPLFFHVLNPYLLVTRSPVTRLEDLAGKRIRIWGKEMPKLIRAAGAIPVPLFLPDIYQAMDNGIIDGFPFSTDLIKAYKMYDLARHITEVVLWEGPSWALWISRKTWETLSPAIQDVLTDISREARKMDVVEARSAEWNARNFLVGQGVRFHRFESGELEKWQAANPDFFQDFIRRSAASGKEAAARKMVAIWQRLRADVGCP